MQKEWESRMNWIENISEAISYIEANLTSKLEIEDIAKKAFISPFYFQKMFKLLCGFTVGEYIRNRRLASAGNDLLTSDNKVIDIALRYGYESTDSFTKAFSRFHGATPAAVRKNGHPIKSYAPLKLELFVKGGYIMDYRLQKQESFQTKVKIDHPNKMILIGKPKGCMDFDIFSLEMHYRNELPEYSCQRVEADEIVDTDNFGIVTAPETIWAVFKCQGVTRDEARESTLRKIKSEWFPQTNYEYLWENMCFCHCYSFKDADDFGEIMIAVKEKETSDI